MELDFLGFPSEKMSDQGNSESRGPEDNENGRGRPENRKRRRMDDDEMVRPGPSRGGHSGKHDARIHSLGPCRGDGPSPSLPGTDYAAMIAQITSSVLAQVRGTDRSEASQMLPSDATLAPRAGPPPASDEMELSHDYVFGNDSSDDDDGDVINTSIDGSTTSLVDLRGCVRNLRAATSSPLIPSQVPSTPVVASTSQVISQVTTTPVVASTSQVMSQVTSAPVVASTSQVISQVPGAPAVAPASQGVSQAAAPTFAGAVNKMNALFQQDDLCGMELPPDLATAINGNLRKRPTMANIWKLANGIKWPTNIPNLQVPALNPELGHVLPQAWNKFDDRMSDISNWLSKALVPVASMLTATGTDPGKTIKDFEAELENILHLLMATLSCTAQARKEFLRCTLGRRDRAFSTLCTWETQVGEKALFPFNVDKKCKELVSSRRLGKPSRSKGGRYQDGPYKQDGYTRGQGQFRGKQKPKRFLAKTARRGKY